MFKHDTDTIDPRDKNLISYNKELKMFIVESSDLHKLGIKPVKHDFMTHSAYTIYMWSEKHQIHICYKQSNQVLDQAGEIVAHVFKPYFNMITTLNETRAHQDSKGTELHIVND